jgi:hypothetical protein
MCDFIVDGLYDGWNAAGAFWRSTGTAFELAVEEIT